MLGNKAITVVGTAGVSTIAYQVADKSQIGKTIVTKGAIPVAGAGVALLGAAMVHDAVTNDKRNVATRIGIGAGVGLMATGTEVVGDF